MINNIERYKELKQASYLSLQYRNKSLASQELCNVVVLKLLSLETRRRVRKAQDMQAFKLAIELLLAGLMVAKSTNKHGWTYRELRDFIHKHSSRFMSTLDSGSLAPRDLAGYRDAVCLMFTPEGFNEAPGGYDAMIVAKHLADIGYLEKESGRLQKKMSIPSVGRTRFYVVKREFMEFEFS